MKRIFILIICALLVTSCASWAEMGETGQVPEETANRVSALRQAYCESPVLSNVEEILVGWIKATVAPGWEPVCDSYRADDSVD